jgi:hypothetical protein
MRYFYLVTFLVFLGLVCFNATAGAATYSYNCPSISDDLMTTSTDTSQCLAIIERTEQLDSDSQNLQARLDLIATGVWFMGGLTTGIWAFRRLGKQMKLWGYQ